MMDVLVAQSTYSYFNKIINLQTRSNPYFVKTMLVSQSADGVLVISYNRPR
jgi:hypothetical protein